MDPAEALRAGAKELEGVLAPEGFAFVFGEEGKGSGGRFANGEYRRGNRRLELHFLWSLGLVTYHVGEHSLVHTEYLRAIRAVTGGGAEPFYPGFSQDPIDAFRGLRRDLERFGEIFLRGSDLQFAELCRWAGDHPAPKGFAALQ